MSKPDVRHGALWLPTCAIALPAIRMVSWRDVEEVKTNAPTVTRFRVEIHEGVASRIEGPTFDLVGDAIEWTRELMRQVWGAR